MSARVILPLEIGIVVVAQSLSRVQLFCDPMDCSLPGSSVHGISQARKLEGVTTPSSRGIPDPGIKCESPAWQADSLPLSHQLLFSSSVVSYSVTLQTAALQAVLSFTISWSLLKLMSIESVMPPIILSSPSPPAFNLYQHPGLLQ